MTRVKTRVILITVLFGVLIAILLISLPLFGWRTALALAQTALGVLTSVFFIMDYVLLRAAETPAERQIHLARTPAFVIMGLSLACIGLGNLTQLRETFRQAGFVILLIGILAGYYVAARISLQNNPPQAGVGLLERMELSVRGVIFIGLLTLLLILGAAYIFLFWEPSSIGQPPDQLNL